MKIWSIKRFLAKIALNLFRKEYEFYIFNMYLASRKHKLVSITEVIVHPDDRNWHEVMVRFFFKDNRKVRSEVFLDGKKHESKKIKVPIREV